jgi:predicted nucleic acid-binding protein
MAIVVDASVAVGWVVLTQATLLTRAALAYVGGNEGWVPSNFAIEVARALRNQERRGLLTPDKVSAGIALLQAQAIKQDQTNAVTRIDTVVGLARQYMLRVADASYLELAIRLTLPLATKDAALARATGLAGIELFNP